MMILYLAATVELSIRYNISHVVYLFVIQEFCRILLLQGRHCVLQLFLKVLHLCEDLRVSRANLCSNLLVLNKLMTQEIHKLSDKSMLFI